jgi:CheY-like chemotaxis protein
MQENSGAEWWKNMVRIKTGTRQYILFYGFDQLITQLQIKNMNSLELILLIDDSDADNFFHKYVIEHSTIPCTVRSVEGSHDGLDYLRQSLSTKDNPDFPTPGLIFLDINMPAMNGFELLRELRSVPDPYERKKNIKIFMLTSSLNPEDRILAARAFSDLVNGFCVKPLTNDVLLSIAKEHFSMIG